MHRYTLSSSSLPLPQTHQPNPHPKPPLQNPLLHTFKTPFELKQFHTQIIKTNTPISILQLTHIASICALTPSFPYATKLIQLSCTNETDIWNHCLKQLADSDTPNNAVRLFIQLCTQGVCLNAFSFSHFIKACTRLEDGLYGKIVHGFIEKHGFQSNLYLLNGMVHLYVVSGEFESARQLFDKMPDRDVVTWNIMIKHLVKRGDVDEAYALFGRMPERNVRSWTAMIMGFVNIGKPKEAIELFNKMEEENVRPNEVTVVAVLAACADLCVHDLGKKIHEFSNRSGFKTNVRICNTLLDMYIKCGCLEAARSVFDEMEERTVVSWSAMIQGLAINGKGEEALTLFSKMIDLRIKPNAVTFIGLLHACSHMGMVNEGHEYFTSMSKDYGIVPQIEHYGCMVDLLSRAGLLKEAREFIKSMRVKPNGVVWGALLGGCRVHKNVELAEEVIEHLLELDPLNDGYYVVLSNIYAEAKRWEDAARVRKLMREKGVKKTPGSSSISVNGVVHEFVAGDESHPQTEAIQERWEKLLEEMRLRGYVPNTSVIVLDIEESEKVKFVLRHSEKLAAVFGLINTAKGTPIRIMKNLRVCEDCHAALKLISEIVDREIVVRDRNRFHCFKNGVCSCKDYW
ncbi:putative tetratricopeptide-like helical domain superfamily, DYW domain-containing protein [Helianthus annuus]|uniref:Putative tetratricopeptide-like helical domain, DYW domain protein n=1 Tax=Helianthus annuus TaxID=4232 RepID=A0A251TBR6_HELAN|nr:pentatricopeptide repeat-containing protein At5g66520 [Helianthus annuus]KAF5782807.1 putative tetratricopeptide-like helical domain superfamily, DYW domain-containing protein [Helianthus annuus]KAJ0502259.1 putative tetratricopeptide-like helical domain superfamily, DYW domain-containing protein [Helianthus annuus]KAJ0510267.1 putative tetratricopeptide-like helical domain superfamily, DYW domain-containing protein [Helianthus annuus]KAJ0518182.1 putative tetratricopeptide-like helical doma